MNPFAHAAFLTSAADLAGLPPAGPAEIAFAGRSNVGKSSAINALAGRKRLAFHSKTPGRTQMLNFFSLGEDARLVDLPGYGFAKVPDSVRRHWDQLVGGFLASRETLAGVVIVMDARHPFKPHDQHLVDWLRPVGCPILVLLSKSDKLTRRAGAETLRAVRARIGEAILFSSLDGEGIEEARDRVAAWIPRRGDPEKRNPR